MPRYPSLREAAGPVDWAAAAEATVRAYAGWHIAPPFRETVTVTAQHRSRDLRLPTGHLVEIHKVEIRDAAGEWRPLDEHEYQHSADGLLRLARGRIWPDGLEAIRVDMTHGFEADEVPDVAAVMETLAERAASGPYGIASQTVNGASVTYQTAGGAPLSIPLLQIEKQALARYAIRRGIIGG